MTKYLYGIINHYYWFLVVIAASLMFNFRDTSSLLLALTVVVAGLNISTFKWKFFDSLVFLYATYCLMTYFFVDVPYNLRLYYLGVRSEIIPILFYFIARGEWFKRDSFFENMRLPLIVAMLFGIYFYFAMPSFYMNYKINVIWGAVGNTVDNLSGHLLYEVTRMSSFWPHSYFIGYSSLFLFMFCSKKIVVDNAYEKKDILGLFLSFFCLFFAQQRVSMAFCVLYLAALTVYATGKRLPNRRWLYLLWIASAICGAGLFFLALSLVGSDFIDYVFERSFDYQGSIVGDRVGLYNYFINRFSILGDGIGRYGHGATELGYIAVPDCDYVRIISQYGFLGLAWLLTICVGALIKGREIFRHAFFEVCCVSFCLVAMLGAAPWELGTLQPFLYWFCIGHINSKFEHRQILPETDNANACARK